MKSNIAVRGVPAVITLIAAVAIASCSESTQPRTPATDALDAAAQPAAVASAPVADRPARNRGLVKSVMNAGGYSYIEVDVDGQLFWIATAVTAVQSGMEIAWRDYAPMRNFNSKSLGRNFEQILFVDRIISNQGTAASAPRRGIVRESLTAAGYSFIRVDENGSSVWLAAPAAPVTAGQAVEWSGGSLMRNFTSRSLQRVFDEIIFVGAVKVS